MAIDDTVGQKGCRLTEMMVFVRSATVCFFILFYSIDLIFISISNCLFILYFLFLRFYFQRNSASPVMSSNNLVLASVDGQYWKTPRPSCGNFKECDLCRIHFWLQQCRFCLHCSHTRRCGRRQSHDKMGRYQDLKSQAKVRLKSLGEKFTALTHPKTPFKRPWISVNLLI